VLSWRVISADGHPVGGSLVFSIGAPTQQPSAEQTSDRSVRVALWLAKFLIYSGLFIGIGGAFFRSWKAPIDSHTGVPGLVTALGVALVALPISVGLQGADALDAPLAALSQPQVWGTGARTSYGLTVLAAMLAAVAALFSFAKIERRLVRTFSLVALLCLGGALALSGHASAAKPSWLMPPAVFVHGIFVTLWIGSLIPLAAALRRDNVTSREALAAFSRAAPLFVALLVLTGSILAVVQVERPQALLGTAYGRVLSAKLTIVTIVLLIALWNRVRLTPAVFAGAPNARRRLVRAVAVEIVLLIVVVGVTGIWRFTPPPRVLALKAEEPAFLHLHAVRAMADVTIRPGRAGPSTIYVVLQTGEFTPLAAKELTVALSNETAGIEPITRSAAQMEGTTWRVADVNLPVSGWWQIRLSILINDFERVTIDGTINIEP
jgi:copper transport protein